MRKLAVILSTAVLLVYAFHSVVFALTIHGVVRQPVNVNSEDLVQFGQTGARVTELSRNGDYGGVFDYKGASLKALLEIAAVQKEVAGYAKSIDLAVVVRNREGKSVTLSWGEIFYRNASNAIVAVSAVPVVPGVTKSCRECHESSFYKPALEKLNRKIMLPKLVMPNDFYTDRNLEDIVSIEVIDLKKGGGAKEGRPSSASFTIIDGKGGKKSIDRLSGYRHIETESKVVGSGRGYHGFKSFQGVPVRELLKIAGIPDDLSAAILVTSTDGYQSLLSYGELVLSRAGEHVVIAEEKGDPRKFVMVVPDDTLADRMVKTVSRIEVIPLRQKGKLYVVGVGCGDTRLITLDAISHMGKVDAFIAPEDITRRFAKYMGGKPVLFDPFTSFEPVFRKNNPGLTAEEVKQKTEALRAAELKSLRETLAAGKSVAVLDWGDPTVYGGWQHWLEPEFAGVLEIAPGISAFSAANAMMGYNLACNRDSMIVSAPKALEANQEMLKAVAEKGDPLVIYMGIRELKTLVPLLLKYYPGNTPVRVVYKAGYFREGRLVKTSLERMIADTEKETEQQLGMIYVGPSLR